MIVPLRLRLGCDIYGLYKRGQWWLIVGCGRVVEDDGMKEEWEMMEKFAG